MKIDKRFEIPFICSAGAVPWSKVWKEWRRATEVRLCSIPCLSLSTPAEEIKEIISGAVASQLLDPDSFHKHAIWFAYLHNLRFRECGWTCWLGSVLSLTLWRTRTGLQRIYIFNITAWWHQCNIICDTFLLSHCSAEDCFRQAKFLQVLLHQSDILMTSQRLLDCLERIWGGSVAKKFYAYIVRGT